ncbi:DDB1- and CUL4-associated factor 6 [Thelohanellus kitauei]|uniref:DDB1-and CUL4-associated factor 6 n=1 Tax=Thelohanellus kitauei TaxID=669202 RepID=A0A0C2N0S5_THEKT|nr:DDB1- and CUL4-associated factor 6 [Thelohanellus kitauei]
MESEPYIFLVCSIEGSVRQYDIREKTSCECTHCTKDVIIHIPSQINSIDVCPTRTYECALAFNNNQIHFFDRRKLYTSAREHDSGKYAATFQLIPVPPPNHSLNITGFTTIKYSDDGADLVCNYVGDKVVVVSCDYHRKMSSSHALVYNPECYTRSSYFDASECKVKKTLSGISERNETETTRRSRSTISTMPGVEDFPIRRADMRRIMLHELGYTSLGYVLSDFKPPTYIPLKTSIYTGHSNVKTMLKEAVFWGKNHILAGSDCGRVFIWDRTEDSISNLLKGDQFIVNSLAYHPYLPVLVCSGIDSTIKVFKPGPSEPASRDEINMAISNSRTTLENYRDLNQSQDGSELEEHGDDGSEVS